MLLLGGCGEGSSEQASEQEQVTDNAISQAIRDTVEEEADQVAERTVRDEAERLVEEDETLSTTDSDRSTTEMAETAGITVGRKAPAFTLTNHADEKVSLKDMTGQWVVLYFYPKADTPGCTMQACDFTEGIESFRDLNATIVGISPDSPEALRKFIDKYDLQITLLSDPDKKVMTKYQAFGEKTMYGQTRMGVIRSTVLIDPQGKVVHHWPNVRAKGHATKVEEKLTEVQG